MWATSAGGHSTLAWLTLNEPPLCSNAGLERCSADTPVDDLIAILRRDGGLVIEGLLDIATVERIDGELDPFVRRRDPGFKDHSADSFYGGNTKRVQGLSAKSPSFVDAILLHPTLLGIADGILLPNCGDYWMSQAETIYIGPGNAAQQLHRDDVNWSRAGELGIDLQVSVLTAVGDYDAEVGATMVVPGSHLVPLGRPVDRSEARPVELDRGSALVYLGSLVHGGGANQTLDRWRKGLYVSYLLGWLTPEEAVARSITPEVAERLPQRARELLGWAGVRGNNCDQGAAAALQLWQLDADDLDRFDGLFTNR